MFLQDIFYNDFLISKVFKSYCFPQVGRGMCVIAYLVLCIKRGQRLIAAVELKGLVKTKKSIIIGQNHCDMSTGTTALLCLLNARQAKVYFRKCRLLNLNLNLPAKLGIEICPKKYLGLFFSQRSTFR